MQPINRRPQQRVKIFNHHYHRAPVTHHHTHNHTHRDHMAACGVPCVPAKSRPAMVSTGTQTDDSAASARDENAGRWQKFVDRADPVLRNVAQVLYFIAGRINFGFGFKVSWLPFIGVGAP